MKGSDVNQVVKGTSGGGQRRPEVVESKRYLRGEIGLRRSVGATADLA